MQLSNHISKLLFDHDCVTVPGFGSFLGNYKSADYDYKEEKFSSGFEFSNPNEIARCGCGESFTVAQ